MVELIVTPSLQSSEAFEISDIDSACYIGAAIVAAFLACLHLLLFFLRKGQLAGGKEAKIKNLGDESDLFSYENVNFLFTARSSWLEVFWLVFVAFWYSFLVLWFLVMDKLKKDGGVAEADFQTGGMYILVLLTGYSFISQPAPEIASYLPNDQFHPLLSSHYQRAMN